MTVKDKKIIDDFIQSSIRDSLDSVQGLPDNEHTQLLFYRRLSKNLSFYFSRNLQDFDSDSLFYETYNH